MTERIYTHKVEKADDPESGNEVVKTEAEIRVGWFNKGLTAMLLDSDFRSLTLVRSLEKHTITVSG